MPQHKCEQAIRCEATNMEKEGPFTVCTWEEKEYKTIVRYEGERLRSINCENKDYQIIFSSVATRYVIYRMKAKGLGLLDFSKQDDEFADDWDRFVRDYELYYLVGENFTKLLRYPAQLKFVVWLLVEEYYLESNV